ncbi:MAG: hypothetical protein ACTSRB_02190, partial [Candidatus Helarchaeota archaeon]
MAVEEEQLSKVEKIKQDLKATKALLHRDEVTWPYQKLKLKHFARRFFPHLSTKEAKKFHALKPEKFMVAVENKLKTTDAFLRPLEERAKALEFQRDLFELFTIFAPKKLKTCQKILEKTPRGIREDFVTEEILTLAAKSGISQKKISELMALWLNMRYYGAMSMGLSPKFLIPFLDTSQKLKEKTESITRALDGIQPEIEAKSEEYDRWVFVKARLDEERKIMTFGPESIKTMTECLELTHDLSLQGEISKKESLEIVQVVKEIINEAVVIGHQEKKTLISEEKREELVALMQKIKEKSSLFFKIAQISNALKKGKPLDPEQNQTLLNIIRVVNLLPDNTKEALAHPEIKETFGMIFEPLENLLGPEGIEIPRAEKKGPKDVGIKLLVESLDKLANWILKRIMEEKKPGLLNILKIFNGIPTILGTEISKIILKKKVKIDLEKFKECIIEHLSQNGIYELYGKISEDKIEKAKEIEVADEIIIPPQADQRLAPILKQIKFEFMKFLETALVGKIPIFDKLEMNRIVPNNVVETLLGTTQDALIKIITANSSNTLHEIINVKREEYEVKLKTITLKLKPLMKNFDDSLIKSIQNLDNSKQLREDLLLSSFKKKVEAIWFDSLITKKKIEIKEQEISTSAVSALAAKLPKGPPTGPPKGPPTGPPKGPPTGPPKGPPTGPPKGPPTGPPKGPPTGPPKGPPTGPPKGPPTGPPKGPPTGPPKGPPTGPPKGPPTGPPKGPLTGILKGPSTRYPKEELITPTTKPSFEMKSKPEKSPFSGSEANSSDIHAKIPDDLAETMIDTVHHLSQVDSRSTRVEREIFDLDEEEKKKFMFLRKTLEEVEELLACYMEDPEKFSPKEITSAFKLLAKIHKINIEDVSPKEIREVISLAEELKIKRDFIVAQAEHVKALNLEKKLTEASLRVLESKLELIVRYFDDYINEINSFIEYLGEKTSFFLKEYQKKAGEAYWKRLRIKKAQIVLRQNVRFLIKIGNLSDEELITASDAYFEMQKAREQKKRKLTGQKAQKIATLVGMDKKKILQMTLNTELRIALEEIFKIKTKSKKI